VNALKKKGIPHSLLIGKKKGGERPFLTFFAEQREWSNIVERRGRETEPGFVSVDGLSLREKKKKGGISTGSSPR